jgi:hypothetical protein
VSALQNSGADSPSTAPEHVNLTEHVRETFSNLANIAASGRSGPLRTFEQGNPLKLDCSPWKNTAVCHCICLSAKLVQGGGMPNLGAPKPIRDLDTEIKLYRLFHDYTKHENSLINNRVTWLAQIHGFLYATFGFCLQKKVEIIQDVSSHVAKTDSLFVYMSKAHLGSSLLELDGFMMFIAIIGISLNINSPSSINAATKAINSVSALFNDQSNIQSYGFSGQELYQTDVVNEAFPVIITGTTLFFLPMLVGGGKNKAHDRGFHSPRRLPQILLWGWMSSIAYFAFDMITNRDYLFHDMMSWIKGDSLFRILSNIGIH